MRSGTALTRLAFCNFQWPPESAREPSDGEGDSAGGRLVSIPAVTRGNNTANPRIAGVTLWERIYGNPGFEDNIIRLIFTIIVYRLSSVENEGVHDRCFSAAVGAW